jgi:hypothetical protein
MDEAKQTYLEMLKISKERPEYFTPEDIQKINANSQFFK